MAQVYDSVAGLMRAVNGSVKVIDGGVTVSDKAAVRGDVMDTLAWNAAFGENGVAEAARYLIRAIGLAIGVFPASIHEYYIAAGRGEITHSTVPACNIRGMVYDCVRAACRASASINAKAVIFEIARSELGYTGQGPAEYAAEVIAAHIREGYTGPVFVQGDHVQANAKNYGKDADKEVAAMHALINDQIAAGFFNIDIDTSTLVDLDKPTLAEQQTLNYELCAQFTQYIRQHEPQGVTVSVGGEIGEVGGQNSTVEDLDAFMEGYVKTLPAGVTGISKISVQTGTSHGGVVLPDGTIKEVSVDFKTLGDLSKVAREKYHIGGAVQHGASTLPKEAFNEFAKSNAVEVHLATGFQNLIFDHPALPTAVKETVYTWLRENRQEERKPGMTDEQFYYTTRKRGFGDPAIKKLWWNMDETAKAAVMADLQAEFRLIFDLLGVSNTAAKIDEIVKPVKTPLPKVDLAVGVAGDD